MDYDADTVERTVRDGKWVPIQAAAVLLGRTRHTIWRWTQGEKPKLRSRPAANPRQGRDLEVHPADVVRHLDEWRARRAAAEQPLPE